eukprot:Rmarinus@m.1636
MALYLLDERILKLFPPEDEVPQRPPGSLNEIGRLRKEVDRRRKLRRMNREKRKQVQANLSASTLGTSSSFVTQVDSKDSIFESEDGIPSPLGNPTSSGLRPLRPHTTTAVQNRALFSPQILRSSSANWHRPEYRFLEHWPKPKSTAKMPEGAKPASIEKPKLLREIEEFIETEMRIRGCQDLGKTFQQPSFASIDSVEDMTNPFLAESSPGAEDAMFLLGIYREAFDKFVNAFSSYEPFLRGVQNAYETVIGFFTDQSDAVMTLKRKLATVEGVYEEEKAKMVKSYEDRVKKSDQLLQEKNIRLRTLASRVIEAEKELQDARGELGAAKDELHQNYDGAEILRRSLEYYKGVSQQNEEMWLRKEEAVLRAKQLSAENEKLEAALDMANHTVEKLEEELGEKRLEAASTKSMFKDVAEKLKAAKEKIAHETEELKRVLSSQKSQTPRPDWERLRAMGRGQIQDMVDLQPGMTTLDGTHKLAVALLERQEHFLMSGLLTPHESPYIQCIGDTYSVSSHTIPRGLAVNGRVRNRRIGRHELGQLIVSIWDAKRVKDEEREKRGKPRMPLRDFAALFFEVDFENRYGGPAEFEARKAEKKFDDAPYHEVSYSKKKERAVAFWMYNLLDGCRRYLMEPEVFLFDGILRGVIDEDVHDDLIETVTSLRRDLSMVSKGGNRVSRANMRDVLRNKNPMKSTANLKKLDEAFERKAGVIDITGVFDRGTHSGQARHKLIDMLRAQYIMERNDYIQQIEAELCLWDRGSGTCKLRHVMDAIRSVDPSIPEENLLATVGRLCGMSEDDMKDEERASLWEEREINLLQISERLRAGVIKRYGSRRWSFRAVAHVIFFGVHMNSVLQGILNARRPQSPQEEPLSDQPAP